MQNRLTSTVLLLGLLGAVIYSITTLHQESDHLGSGQYQENQLNRGQNPTNVNSRMSPSFVNPKLEVNRSQGNNTSNQNYTNQKTLPINLRLLGVSINDSPAKCMLESGGEINEFIIGDLIFEQSIQVVEIKPEGIVLAYESKTYELALNGINLYAKKEEKSKSDLLKMSAEEIGNRPKVVEHLVQLTPTPYIADGMIASPGLSPILFEQAGLQIDDVITEINGKSLTIPEELEQLQKTIRHADTLVIKVMRKGRRLTLYLDIPSEALTLSR